MKSVGKVCALIPARSGSKSVKDKNIRIMNDRPMLAYSIMHGLEAKLVDTVFVSTDSQIYADIAKKYNAEVPFLRPAECSTDTALDIDVFRHFLRWLIENDYELPELLVHLRPTHPIRDSQDIDNMVQMLIDNPDADSVRSVSPAQEVPYKMWLFNDEDKMSPLVTCDVPEAYNSPRQILPKVYMQNACIDVMRTSTILKKNSMTGNVILGYKMDMNFDIDTESEFLRAEQFMTLQEKILKGEKLRIVCDIDGVIAGKTPGNDYSRAFPMERNISILQKLAANGHEIILHTARGYATGIDWKETTEKQMSEWEVPFTQIVFGKPNADFYIDDKLVDLSMLGGILL